MVINGEISLRTHGDSDILDITAKVEKFVLDSQLKSGTVMVFVNGSTAGVTSLVSSPVVFPAQIIHS